MSRLALVLVCAALAGCSQTSGLADASSPSSVSAYAAPGKSAEGRKESRCDSAIRGQANAAMLGSALSMAGGLGGFGGRGGMIAAQVAGTAGNMLARSQQQQAQATVMRECSQPE